MPITRTDDYVTSVSDALNKHWSKAGQFVFTSSAGVYAENNQGVVDEDSPVKTPADGGAHSKHSDL